MKSRSMGRGGVQVAEIGQGTWKMEGQGKAAIKALQRGIDLGLTHIDTAEMYGHGAVEKIVGEAIRGRREQVFLVSKILPSHASFEGTLEACERSLKHLQTSCLDLLLLHWRGNVPLEETFRAFDQLAAQGKIQAFGVSNFDRDDLEEAVKLVGSERIACNQVLYHLQERAIESGVLPWCEKKGIAIVAYSPFGQGSFPSEKSAGGKVLAEIGRPHRKTARQAALRFLLRSPHVFVIPKSSQVSHVEENAGAADFELSPEEVARIHAAFPAKVSRHLPML